MSGVSRSGTAGSPRPSARLGLTLRALLVNPSVGFGAALKAADRKARVGKRLPEGATPYLLAALGGASALLLWLKLGGLLGLRDAPVAAMRTAYIPLAAFTGALLGLLCQGIWGLIASVATHTTRRSARVVWGGAALPAVLALAVLLPLDLLLIGANAFATDGLADGVSTAWAAASFALWLATAVWSASLFVIGVRVATGSWRRTARAGAIALLVGAALWLPPLLYARIGP